jgi:hypothetical protein
VTVLICRQAHVSGGRILHLVQIPLLAFRIRPSCFVNTTFLILFILLSSFRVSGHLHSVTSQKKFPSYYRIRTFTFISAQFQVLRPLAYFFESDPGCMTVLASRSLKGHGNSRIADRSDSLFVQKIFFGKI